jgi:hypothetical protein
MAGASGRREHERRRAAREQRVRDRHPLIGGALLALGSAPRHERVWATGAAGEEALARTLAARCPGIPVLHDRRMPRSRTNIDHLAVGASAVYVIDTKRYKGKVEVRKSFFGEPKLLIAGRDRTKLVDGLRRQVEAVRGAIGEIAPDVPVRGCFCFVPPEGSDSGIPLLRTLSIAGFDLLYPRRLAKRLRADGELTADGMASLANLLARSFPPA